MPYEICLAKHVEVADHDRYINECCVGGDIVLNYLLPFIRATFGDVQADQEDWGWLVWFDYGGVKLAVDVFTDDPVQGEFRIHLTSRRPRLILGPKVVDTPQLESLMQIVTSSLESWPVAKLETTRLDAEYDPL